MVDIATGSIGRGMLLRELADNRSDWDDGRHVQRHVSRRCSRGHDNSGGSGKSLGRAVVASLITSSSTAGTATTAALAHAATAAKAGKQHETWHHKHGDVRLVGEFEALIQECAPIDNLGTVGR